MRLHFVINILCTLSPTLECECDLSDTDAWFETIDLINEYMTDGLSSKSYPSRPVYLAGYT